MEDITVIILTKNEEKNIVECIKSIRSIAKRIVVVDSFSTDKTVEYAITSGAEVIQNQWINYATQFNYGIDNANIDTQWVLRFDADERLTDESAAELASLIHENKDTNVNGIVVRFEVTFLGRKLKHGGIYPFKKLLAFKYGKGHMENRNMDEHIILDEGFSVEMKHDSIHCDYKDLSTWIDKHNKYSSREVKDYFASIGVGEIKSLNKSARLKRFIKFTLYYKLPMGARAKWYYWYRYYIKLGFLDGKEGKIFAFLQAYWYRYLVDAKIYEAKILGEEK